MTVTLHVQLALGAVMESHAPRTYANSDAGAIASRNLAPLVVCPLFLKHSWYPFILCPPSRAMGRLNGAVSFSQIGSL